MKKDRKVGNEKKDRYGEKGGAGNDIPRPMMIVLCNAARISSNICNIDEKIQLREVLFSNSKLILMTYI